MKSTPPLSTTHPHLCHETKENLDNYTYGSRHSVLWNCPVCGYSWKSRISNRAMLNRGCPNCAGKIIIHGINDLLTTHPEIAKEALFDASLVGAGSGKTLSWVCKTCSYVWKARVRDRTGRNHAKSEHRCPRCANIVITIGINDFGTTHPHLAKEALFDVTKVSYGSQKKLMWKCQKCSNEWEAPPNRRTNMKSGCPLCAKYGFRPDDPAIFYVVSSRVHRLIKYGITKTESKKSISDLTRIVRHKKNGFTELVTAIEYKKGCDAQATEAKVKNLLKEMSITPPATLRFDGWTECFSWDDLSAEEFVSMLKRYNLL